jgi:hypothetical protein
MLSLAGIAGGIALLIGGGALLVRGASEIATRHNISPIIVGLVIVGFGTSSPELVVNIIGAATGAGELAFGNAVGSNIANLGLILGITACLVPITIQSSIVRRELPLLLLATTMILVLALDGPIEGRPAVIGRSDSVVLLLVFTIFIYVSALDMIRVQSKDPLLSEIALHTDVVVPSVVRYPWLMVVGGFVLLYLGGEVTIRNSVTFAESIGIPAAIVGLFVVSEHLQFAGRVARQWADRQGECAARRHRRPRDVLGAGRDPDPDLLPRQRPARPCCRRADPGCVPRLRGDPSHPHCVTVPGDTRYSVTADVLSATHSAYGANTSVNSIA